ncbi:MAG TPA: VCBS repeat-containing protein [Chitinophagaceae bacterium]|nr:VCBS repeat-containing protein [Chitinophagaceae bacterium]
MARARKFFFFSLLLLATACRQEKQQAPLFELMEQTGIDFANSIQNTEDFNIFSYRNFYNGGGVAIGDINNDGLSDVLFTANMGPNKLYLNKGNWQFEDISANAGFIQQNKWSTGVVMVDINNDGWLDIYVCNAGYEKGKLPQNQLYINNGKLGFTEAAEQYGLTNTGGYCTHAAFLDYDLDGDLDCFIVNNSFIPVNTLNYANKRMLRAKDWPVADFLKGGGDKLLRNDNGRFVDVSESAGIYGSLISFGLGVTVGDVNGDHYPDVYVSNDFFERDYLYINQRNGTFKDELEQRTQHTSFASMGADMADVNNDGHPDIFVTDMLPDDEYRLKTTSSFENIDVYRLKERSGFYHQFTQNTLQLNNSNGKFKDVAFYSGVAASDWSWGALMFDADNDGLTDIYVCNGIYHDVTDQDFIDFFDQVNQRMAFSGRKEDVEKVMAQMPSNPIPNKAFRNKGDLKFSDEGRAWGLAHPSFSNGSAYGDLDNDGDLDLVVNNVQQKAFVYRNNSRQQNTNNYIGLQLKTKGPNGFAIGSKVKIFAGDQVITREINPSRGFQSSVDYKIVAGLGQRQVDSILITWPDRTETKMQKPAINRVHVIKQAESGARQIIHDSIAQPLPTLLTQVESNFEKHTEDDHIDFYNERNVPKLLSREGPCSAVGDLNRDGLNDVFIGGAAGQRGRVYMGTPTGFVENTTQVFYMATLSEDAAASFFDCDNDGDLDLFVGSGGNSFPEHSAELLNRMYFNMGGTGNFEPGVRNFPDNRVNVSVAAPHDFDNDGDVDLFVGGRSVPMQYGITPLSLIYMNDGKGNFTGMSLQKLGGIDQAGMVTDAVWADVAGDAQKELIIVGEWMAPRVFAFKANHFEEIKTNLSSMMGWWQCVKAADIDGDKDLDLVLGNIGENFYLQPTADKPVKMWIKDFDKNGGNDVIITRAVNGKDMPIFLKRELTEQLPSLKKQNLKHKDYATKSIRELLTAEQLNNSMVREFNYASSCIAINDGNGQYRTERLPAAVQFSSVNAIVATDLNKDGKVDLLMGGNEFGFQPQFARLDASPGHVLMNNGKGGFTLLPESQTGLQLRGQVREMAEIPVKDKRYILVLQNDDYPKLFKINP